MTDAIRIQIDRILADPATGLPVVQYLQLMMPMVPPARGSITEMENIDFGDGAVDAERLFQRAVYLTGFTNRIVFVPADEPGTVRFYYSGVIGNLKGYGPVKGMSLPSFLGGTD